MLAVYDLARNPPTYDVLHFILGMEMGRVRTGADFVEVVVASGPVRGFARDNLWPPREQREGLLQAIVLPMIELLPSVRAVRRSEAAPLGWGAGKYHGGLATYLAALGAIGRPLRPREPVTHDPSLVTITLREGAHWPARNSDLQQWLAAARTIEADGYRVVFVRDTLHADEALPGFTTAPGASRDLHSRARLYRAAVVNLFVNNGPAWLAVALDAPVLVLKPTTEGVGRSAGAAFWARAGLPHGAQLPQSPAYQRIVWKPDTAVEIVAAFREMMAENKLCRSAA